MGEILRSAGRPKDARGITMLEWLRKRRQPVRAIANFWRLVLVSALDEELDRTEAQYGIDVFWKAFVANRAGFRMGVPAAPLGDLYEGCRAALERRGGEIRTRARAAKFRIEQDRVAALAFEDGSEESADAYVAAVPHGALLEMLPPELVEREPAFGNLRQLRASPITGIHLWYDRRVTEEPFLALVGLESQWIFNKSALLDPAPEPPSEPAKQYLQVVISASYELVSRSRQEIVDLVRKEMETVLPAARGAQVVKATVVKETAATFSPAPGVDEWRPESQGPIGQLFLAGDWTRTGWPATMEGAVRSGYLAAQAVLNLAGQHRTFLQPDLPAEGFVHLWS
jgi:zeta-carotene desaturase